MEVINLNLIPTGALPVVHASQYDEGRTFRANLMDGSTVYTLDGTETLECDVKKPDGNIVTVAVTNTSDSYVEIDTTLQMCACAGDSLAELHITKGAQEIGTLNFILAVERSPLEGGIESASELHNLQEQIGEAVAEQYAAEDVVFDAAPVAGHGTGFAVTSEGVKTYVEGEIAALTIPEELDDLQDVELTSPTAGQIMEYDGAKWKNVANPASTTNFGAPYDENTTYNVPSLVIENNLLYKLNDGEVNVTGPFDPTKWTQTSVAELAANIGSLSALTTTEKGSLVGAVNEVDAGLDALNNPEELTITPYTGVIVTSGAKAYQITDRLICVNFEVTIPTASSSWVNCFDIDFDIPFSTSNFGVVSDGGTNHTFIQAFWLTNKILVRINSPRAVQYRGQVFIVIK